MALDETFDHTVHFVGRTTQGGEDVKIGGTAFLISVPSFVHEDATHKFLVTAGHVVSHAPTVVIRSPTQDGSVVDSHVGGWITHPSYDVAIAPAVLPRDNAHYEPVPIHSFVDAGEWSQVQGWTEPFAARLGDKIYFIGLLSGISTMIERRVPIVRSGTIARLWLDAFPVRDQWDRVVDMTVHLIDGSAYGGLSGAPCFVEQSRAYIEEPEDGQLQVGTRYRIGLLGLIGGHLDELRPLVGTESESRQGSMQNRGIAHVIPAEHIRETLEMDEAVEVRTTLDRIYSEYKAARGSSATRGSEVG